MATVLAFLLGLIIPVHSVTVKGLSPMFKGQSERPHLTGCVSREMESFYCTWSVGAFRNLTEAGDLRLFYMLQDTISPKEWLECPKYTGLRENECHFDNEHTKIWAIYKVQLRSRHDDNVYDEVQFTVENIVYPDPPVGLNWTVLSTSMTNMYADVLLSWDPPPSVVNHVEIGWLVLEYETQYREANSAVWTILNAEKETRRYIYGLRINTDYEVRVRCRMQDFNNFSNFSDTIMINVSAPHPAAPSTQKQPEMAHIALGFFFTAIGFVILGFLVLITRQKKLMVIFLPPVPGPKIRGIDPQLLKEGKLAELSAILSSHSVLRPDPYNEDSWVEFIGLDIEKPIEGEQDLETAFLIDHSPSPSPESTHIANDFRDDDSGRSSCCEQDLPDSDTAEIRTSVQSSLLSSSSSSAVDPGVKTEARAAHEVNAAPQESWPGTPDLYAQVRQVTASGEVVLTPEERSQTEEAIKTQEKTKSDQTKKHPEFHLLVLDDSEKPDDCSEPNAHNMTTSQSPGPHGHGSLSAALDEVNSPFQQQLAGHREEPEVVALTSPASGAAAPQSPLLHSTPPGSPSGPTPEYTVVDGTDSQNSLLLRSNVTVAPASSPREKQMPSPEGYLTPDLLDRIAF